MSYLKQIQAKVRANPDAWLAVLITYLSTANFFTLSHMRQVLELGSESATKNGGFYTQGLLTFVCAVMMIVGGCALFTVLRSTDPMKALQSLRGLASVAAYVVLNWVIPFQLFFKLPYY
jgi:hypothetical protein